MDKTFLETIRDSFVSSDFSTEYVGFLAVLLVVIAAAVAAGMLINRYLTGKRGPNLPANLIVSPARIEQILERMRDQRAKAEVRFAHESSDGRFLPATLDEVRPDALDFDLSGFAEISRDWLDKRMEVYFKLSRDNRHEFYGFEARVMGAVRTTEKTALLTLARPQSIEIRQKRSFLRIDPPQPLVRSLCLWRERSGEDGDPSTRIKDWGRPLVCLPGEGKPKGRILNISAGGLRLEMRPGPGERSAPRAFAVGRRFFVRLELFDPEQQDVLSRTFLTRVRNVFEDFATGRRELGLSFLAQAETSPTRPGEVRWQPIPAESGCQAIDNWVFKRHLEIYRDKTGG